MRKLLVVLVMVLGLGMYGTAFTQEVEYTTLLLPVGAGDIVGANGSLWSTELTLLNHGSAPVEIYCFSGTCAPLEPGRVLRPVAPPLPSIVPGLIHLPSSQLEQVSVAVRSRNATPGSPERDFVSEIPVVSELECSDGAIELLAVPIEPDYRHTLRVYDVNATSGAQVRVQIFGMTFFGAMTLLDERVLTLGTVFPRRFERPAEPAWAALGNFADEIQGVRTASEVRIRIEPLTSGLKLWAFVTATSNATQRFAIYTP